MSSASSPRSPVSSTFEKFEKRINLENLLKEAHLDRDALLGVLKQNPVELIHDLDETKIESIIQQVKEQERKSTKANPFALTVNTHCDNEENEANEINSHYRIIKNECIALRASMRRLQNKMKTEYHLNNMQQKKQHNERLHTLRKLAKKKTEVMEQCNKMKQKCETESELISLNIKDIDHEIESIHHEQEDLLLKKIALQQNVAQCRTKLHNIRTEKKRFREMRDISQFKPIAVFYVLKYLEIGDFISCILCCKAWYFSLNKPSYFRVLQRNVIIRNKEIIYQREHNQDHELVSSETKLKRINHAVMQLKIEPKKTKMKGKSKKNNVSTPRPDDIYSQCMQQLQKVIAQSDQDREELEDRVKAQMGILKFMQTSMFRKMDELSCLRVRKWELRNKSVNGYQIEKKRLHEMIKNLERELGKHRLIVQNIKENMASQRDIRIKKLKIQKDLKSVKSGTATIGQMNELKKLKQQTKKLAQVIVQLRKEIPKRNQECKKYKNRVDLLQSQYSQYANDPLP